MKIELEVILSTLPFKQIEAVENQLLDSNTSLYIIGNGFDIMHEVPSNYYNFRDFNGNNNTLRFTLETYIMQDDIWGNFENSLAYLDREVMLESLDYWLAEFDVPDEDDAINNTVRLIEVYYENSAKKTSEVIASNQLYFKLLEGIKRIVVIGHSLSNGHVKGHVKW